MAYSALPSVRATWLLCTAITLTAASGTARAIGPDRLQAEACVQHIEARLSLVSKLQRRARVAGDPLVLRCVAQKLSAMRSHTTLARQALRRLEQRPASGLFAPPSRPLVAVTTAFLRVLTLAEEASECEQHHELVRPVKGTVVELQIAPEIPAGDPHADATPPWR
jgi:hypothetical protein